MGTGAVGGTVVGSIVTWRYVQPVTADRANNSPAAFVEMQRRIRSSSSTRRRLGRRPARCGSSAPAHLDVLAEEVEDRRVAIDVESVGFTAVPQREMDVRCGAADRALCGLGFADCARRFFADG